MKGKKRISIKLPVIICSVIIIVIISVVYIVQLNNAIIKNTLVTIREMAEHDENTIWKYTEMTWENLRYIEGKLSSYDCQSIEELERQMELECENSKFSHIYMIAEDGTVYPEECAPYSQEDKRAKGGLKLSELFIKSEDKTVMRFNDQCSDLDRGKASLLHGVRLHNFSVSGIKMEALVGISDIKSIQNNLVIDSFYKNDISRGYSAVIDMRGNYIVNVNRNGVSNNMDNFFRKVSNGQKSDLSHDEAAKKMAQGETFSFYFVGDDGVERLVYLKPFGSRDIPWYFLMSVDEVVFTEQLQMFLMMSMLMMTAVVLVVVILLTFVMVNQRKADIAKADAKARSEFLANMSHEIRTPLNGIIGLVHLMEKDIENKAENTWEIIKDRLSKTRSTAGYLLSLINDILDMSKLKAGKVELNNRVISAEDIFESIWTMQRENIESRGIRFVAEKNIIEPWIVADDTHVKQVLMNIVSNAAKFTPAGGQIKLSVSQEREENGFAATTFVCSDTGCGMTEEFVEHIWDSFSQEHSENAASVKGTGLGMAISKLLTEAMGGELKVESRLNEGSTFIFTLHSQIARKPEISDNKAEKKIKRGKNDKPLKILVAEDIELNAEILMEILKSEGFEAVHAQNGKIAVEMFRESDVGEFDVILMDMQMPVMDGCSAAEKIRKSDRKDAEEVLIFACTANSFEEDKLRAKQSGMDDFLAKPIDVNVLLKKLETAG